MHPPSALPAPLSTGTFAVVDAHREGMTVGRLRHSGLAMPTVGLRRVTTATSVHEHAAAFAKIVRGDFAFSHVTAARLLGLPTPTAWSATEQLDVMTSGNSHVRRPEVTGHRGLTARTVVDLDGLPVVDGLDTFVDLAASLGHDDLVVLGDALVCRDPHRLASLTALVCTRRRARGIVTARAAALDIRLGSGSPMETRSRLVLTRGGVPEPELNADIFDDHGGWIACGDLVWRVPKVVGEYQGKEHRTAEQQAVDVARRRLLEGAGWHVEEIVGADIFRPARQHALVQRFLAILGARSRR